MSPVPGPKTVNEMKVKMQAIVDDLERAGLISNLEIAFDNEAVYFKLVIKTSEAAVWMGDDDDGNNSLS